MQVKDRAGLIAKLDEMIKSLPDDDLRGIDLANLVETGTPLTIDSLSMLDLSLKLEDDLGVRLTDEQLTVLRDPRALVDLLSEALGVDG